MKSKTFEENKKIALLNKYTDVYNNLDNLCWSIPTRVFAANLVSSIAVAFRPPAEGVHQNGFIFVIVFSVLSIVNYLGSKSLWRLWMDQVRMGYAIKRFDEPMGYFRSRHENPECFDLWKDSRGQFSLFNCLENTVVRSSARGLNVLMLLLLSYIFAAIAAIGLAGLLVVKNHLSFYLFLGTVVRDNYLIILFLLLIMPIFYVPIHYLIKLEDDSVRRHRKKSN